MVLFNNLTKIYFIDMPCMLLLCYYLSDLFTVPLTNVPTNKINILATNIFTGVGYDH